MPEFYSREQRTLQERFETRKLADLLVGAIVHRFLATVDADGQPTCSYKGGDPGVAHVVDRTTLAFPSYDGNGMFLSLGNVRSTARVGLLFIDVETPHRLRVQGTASVREGDPLLGLVARR